MNILGANPLHDPWLAALTYRPIFVIHEVHAEVVHKNKQRTIDYISDHPGCGVKEISEALKVSQAYVAHQLSKVLMADGCKIKRIGKPRHYRYFIK